MLCSPIQLQIQIVRNFFCCSYRSIEYRTSTNHSRNSKNQLILDQADPNLADGDLYTQHKGHHKKPANSAPRSDRLFRFVGFSFPVPRRVNANRTSVPATSCIAILYCVVFLVFRWPISPVSSFFISLFVYSSLKFIALKVIIIAIRCALECCCTVPVPTAPTSYGRQLLSLRLFLSSDISVQRLTSPVVLCKCRSIRYFRFFIFCYSQTIVCRFERQRHAHSDTDVATATTTTTTTNSECKTGQCNSQYNNIHKNNN